MYKIAFFIFLGLVQITVCMAQPQELVYKTIDTTHLRMKLYYPPDYKKGTKYPVIIFFFGGGWLNGTSDQFKNQAIYLASKGMIAVTADYRVEKRQGTTPFECVKDGRSAIRYLRKHAEKLGIASNQIVASGGSAGGHVAAAADLTLIDEKTDDLSISPRPNALVLFNPVFNNGPGNYGYERIREKYPLISPYHNIKKGAAPAIVFLGTRDKLISVQIAKDYQQKMREVGSRCDLILYEDQGHGFFNFEKSRQFYHATLEQTVTFLKDLGFIS
jgi:acetyl esterase/lipase